MNATATDGDAPEEEPVTVNGDTVIEPKKDYQDMIFLSNQYDHYRDLP